MPEPCSLIGILCAANGLALLGNLALNLHHGLLADGKHVNTLLHFGWHGAGGWRELGREPFLQTLLLQLCRIMVAPHVILSSHC